jgi:hypothetical protein
VNLSVLQLSWSCRFDAQRRAGSYVSLEVIRLLGGFESESLPVITLIYSARCSLLPTSIHVAACMPQPFRGAALPGRHDLQLADRTLVPAFRGWETEWFAP